MIQLRLLACMGFGFALGITGTFEHNDELRHAEQYCENVNAGVWGDYKGTYDKFCKDGKYTEK